MGVVDGTLTKNSNAIAFHLRWYFRTQAYGGMKCGKDTHWNHSAVLLCIRLESSFGIMMLAPNRNSTILLFSHCDIGLSTSCEFILYFRLSREEEEGGAHTSKMPQQNLHCYI